MYFTKSTNRELYKYVNIMEYHDGTYVLTNPISEHNILEMRNNMDDNDVVEFDKFLQRNWGIKMKGFEAGEKEDYDLDDLAKMQEQEAKTSKRGRKPKTIKE